MFMILWEGEHYIISMKKKLFIIFNGLLFIAFGIIVFFLVIVSMDYFSLKKQFTNIKKLNAVIDEVESRHDELFNKINVVQQGYDTKNKELEDLLQENDDLNNRPPTVQKALRPGWLCPVR